MSKRIVLLDVDGVLVHARAYRAASQAAVEYMARRMGQPHISGPDEAAMLAFEARSIISEWDSIALCTAELLAQTPDLLGASLDESLQNIAQSGRKLDQPDFAALARRCPPPHDGLHPGPAALGTMFPKEPAFVELLMDTHRISGPMTTIFQHYTLGHTKFEATYGLDAQFEADSLLETLDVPMLSAQSRDRLLNDPATYPVIYTARPSLPPEFVSDQHGYAPEAEMAQHLVGLDDVPLIGYGKVHWLALTHDQDESHYLKPSPTHAEIAIVAALLYGTDHWEIHAFDIATGLAPLPETLKDEPWHVIVCEDSTGGIRGVRGAVERLQALHDVTLTAVGIGTQADNVAALESVADIVAPDVNAGLAQALDWE